MKISVNRALDSDQVTDLFNHLHDIDAQGLEKPMFPDDPPAFDLDDLASKGFVDVGYGKTAQSIIDWLEKNVPRVIVWLDDKVVVNKYGNNPKDLEAESAATSVVKRLLDS